MSDAFIVADRCAEGKRSMAVKVEDGCCRVIVPHREIRDEKANPRSERVGGFRKKKCIHRIGEGQTFFGGPESFA